MRPLTILLIFISACALSQSNTIEKGKFNGKYREFDFWIGEWDVNLRRQQPDGTWADWKKARTKIYPILEGRAILELWEEQSDDVPANVIVGYSLRFYNPDSDDWTLLLNWPGPNRSGSSRLTGSFRHGRGEFFAKRQINDTTILLTRYSFSDITPNSLRWDDGFSRDGGKTWTHSWIMEFTRAAAQPSWPGDTKLHTYRKGERCTLKEFSELSKFVGHWEGTVSYEAKGKKSEAVSATFYQTLGGCSVMSFWQIGTEREFSLMTFNTYAMKFEDGRLSSGANSRYRSFFGDWNGDILQLNERTDGTDSESYTWTMQSPRQLKVEKWEARGDKKVKVYSAVLSKN